MDRIDWFKKNVKLTNTQLYLKYIYNNNQELAVFIRSVIKSNKSVDYYTDALPLSYIANEGFPGFITYNSYGSIIIDDYFLVDENPSKTLMWALTHSHSVVGVAVSLTHAENEPNDGHRHFFSKEDVVYFIPNDTKIVSETVDKDDDGTDYYACVVQRLSPMEKLDKLNLKALRYFVNLSYSPQ